MNESITLHSRRRRDPPDRGGDHGQGRASSERGSAPTTRGRQLTLVSVLKGSLPFMADLMRAIDIPVRIDLMEVSSYGGTTTESSGLVRILKDLSASIEGEDVLIVEDIIDTGLTLNYLIRYLRGKKPGVAADLHAARQAGPPARRDPGRLHGLHDPRPVRRRLRPRLRRALPQPALRGRPRPEVYTGTSRRVTMHRRPARPGPDARRARRAAHRRRLRPAVVAGRRRRRASPPVRATASRAAGSSSSWSGS